MLCSTIRQQNESKRKTSQFFLCLNSLMFLVSPGVPLLLSMPSLQPRPRPRQPLPVGLSSHTQPRKVHLGTRDCHGTQGFSLPEVRAGGMGRMTDKGMGMSPGIADIHSPHWSAWLQCPAPAAPGRQQRTTSTTWAPATQVWGSRLHFCFLAPMQAFENEPEDGVSLTVSLRL